MPRINIDDKLFSDFRFIEFSMKVGCHYKAIGLVVRIWQTAQRYWAPNLKPIPISIYHRLEGSKLFEECGLSKRIRAGQYVLGSREQFAWLIQKHDASHKASESRKKKHTVRTPAGTVRTPSSLTPVKLNSSENESTTLSHDENARRANQIFKQLSEKIK